MIQVNPTNEQNKHQPNDNDQTMQLTNSSLQILALAIPKMS